MLPGRNMNRCAFLLYRPVLLLPKCSRHVTPFLCFCSDNVGGFSAYSEEVRSTTEPVSQRALGGGGV